MGLSHHKPTTSFSVTMWTEGSSRWKPSVYCWPTRSSTQRTSFFSEATTSVQASIEYTVSMMSVSLKIRESGYGFCGV